jgi:hypothetical protein
MDKPLHFALLGYNDTDYFISQKAILTMRYNSIIYILLICALTACNLQSDTNISEITSEANSTHSQDISQTPLSIIEITPLAQISTSVPLTNTPELVIVDDSIGPYTFPSNVNPLTGLMVADATALARRPIVVKISNAPAIVRPQAAIGAADIVFEHYVEGGLTRFSAVFYGQVPQRVGSLRSARLIDHEIVPMFGGILVFWGASIGVDKYIYGSKAIDPHDIHAPHGFVPPSDYVERAYKGVLYGAPYFWRDDSIIVPHNAFGNLEMIWQLAAADGHNQRPILQGLAFLETRPPAQTSTANVIDIRYRATRVRWEYDAISGLYSRFADGQAHLDANTQKQVTAANVVVIYAEHTDTDIVESVWQGNNIWSTQIALLGEGSAVLCRDGLRYDGYWIRAEREDIIGLRTTDGQILHLKPGNTWFQIIRTPQQQNLDSEGLIVE